MGPYSAPFRTGVPANPFKLLGSGPFLRPNGLPLKASLYSAAGVLFPELGHE